MMARVRGRAVGLTTHALDRYLERVLAFNGDRDRARRHLTELAARVGTIERDAPAWVTQARTEREVYRTDWFLLLGPDIALPVVDGRAVTVLARGHMSDLARANRNRARQHRQSRRRSARIGLGGRPASEEWAA